jgi:hypothetical protein
MFSKEQTVQVCPSAKLRINLQPQLHSTTKADTHLH